MKPAFFTICSYNYFAQAAVLRDTLEAAHPGAEFVVFLCDLADHKLPDDFDRMKIVRVDDLQIPDFDLMLTRYTILELNTAVKPFCMARLIEEGCDAVIYLDPDLYFLSPIKECFDLLDSGANIILTPHTTRPIEDNYNPNDFDMARAGIYNLGFCVVKNSEAGREFIGWWCRKLLANCRVDLPNGIFVDQKWCDGVPALFPGVEVLRHPGYNVGYWNLMHASIRRDPERGWLSNEEPLRFFHFSGIEMRDSDVISKHQNRIRLSHLPMNLQELFYLYRLKLLRYDFFNIAKLAPRIDVPALDKTTKTIAVCYVEQFEKFVRSKATIGFEEFVEGSPFSTYLLGKEPVAQSKKQKVQENKRDRLASSALTDIMLVVYASRGDLQKAFPSNAADFDRQYLDWFSSRAPSEHDFGDCLAPRLETLLKLYALGGLLSDYAPVQDGYASFRKVLSKREPEELVALAASFYGDFAPTGPDDGKAPVPLFLTMLYERRPDVQEMFELDEPEGRQKFLAWFASASIRQKFDEMEELSAFYDAYDAHGADWAKAFSQTRSAKVVDPDAARKASKMRASIRYGLVAPGAYKLFASDRLASTPSLPPLREGAALIGYPRAEMGMGEHVRNSAASLLAAGYPFDIVSANTGLNCTQNDHSFDEHVVELPARQINLFHINADQTMAAERILGRAMFQGRYNIGYWAWELENFPSQWSRALDLMDEVWAPSDFTRDSIRRATGKPVLTMPLRVEPGDYTPYDLASLGYGKDDFVFLFFFDFSSYHQRKNPFAVIRAFQQAFPTSRKDKVGLVIKTIGRKAGDEGGKPLKDAIDSDPRMRLVADVLPRAEMSGLVKACSSFVSLHRSEGFGRGLAEAMYYGRPVIGTGYSGNMDFMTPENSFLVDYDLIPVRDEDYVHPSGSSWANPSLEHAAFLMRQVVEDKDEANRRGAQGAKDIRRNHSAEAVGRALTARLKEIDALIGGRRKTAKGAASEQSGGRAAARQLETLGK